MCNAISLLLTGRLSDKFGRRYFLLFAGGLAIIGGIVACTAKTMNTLIGANVSRIPKSLCFHLASLIYEALDNVLTFVGYNRDGFRGAFFPIALYRRYVSLPPFTSSP